MSILVSTQMSQIAKVPAASSSTSSAVAPKESPLYVKLLTAGTAACVADFVTFPLDTAKVRLQVRDFIFSITIFLN